MNKIHQGVYEELRTQDLGLYIRTDIWRVQILMPTHNFAGGIMKRRGTVQVKRFRTLRAMNCAWKLVDGADLGISTPSGLHV